MRWITKALGSFIGAASEATGVFSGTKGRLIGRSAPFIAAESKQQFIDDFTVVKYAYAVVHWISTKAAKVPFTLYRKTGTGRERVDVNRLLEILDRPNNYQSRFDFLYQFYGFLLTTGAGYIYAPKASTGRFAEMHVIPSDYVQPVYEKRFAGPVAFIVTDSGLRIPAEDMIYVFLQDLDYVQVGVGQEGLSPFKPLRTVMQKTADIDKADLASIQNGGVMGILGFDAGTNGEPITPEQAAMVEQRVKDKAYGPSNKGKFFVSSQKPTWVPIGMSPIDLNLYQANQQVLKDICIVLNVPYAIFDPESSSKQSGAQQAELRKQAYTDAILPMVERFTDSMNTGSVAAFGEGLVLDYSTNEIEELQTDLKMLAETHALQYYKTVADKQREAGMEVDPEMEGVYLVPNGLVRMDDILMDFQLPEDANGRPS